MRSALLLSVACVLIPTRGWADDTHYQDYPIGGRAVGLGGAFTALANDPSGVFYNPAGLVDQTKHSVQISTNLYGLEISDSFFNAVDRATELDTVFTELNVIPASAAFAGVLQKDEDERPLTSYGLGVFVPSYRSVNVRTLSESQSADSPCDTVSYGRSVSDRTFQLGAAIGQRVDDTWSLGFSLNMAYRTLREREDAACSTGTQRFSTALTNVSLAVASLFATAGIKARYERWRFGATLSSPTVRAFDVATVTVQRGSALEGEAASEFFIRELSGLSANTKRGPQLRVGSAYIIPRTATFTLDVHFYAGTRYNLFTLPPGEDDVAAAITTARRIVRNPVVNVAGGAEYLFTKRFSIALGLFTNFSSADGIGGEVGDTFESDRLPQIHSAGGSMVIGFFSKHALTRLGFTMSYGEGTDVVPRTPGLRALDQPDEFVKAEISQLFGFVYLSSTFRY